MQDIILKSLQIPTGLEGADNGSVNQSEILPMRMNRIIGEFDESLLTVLGCKEAAEQEKQTDAA